MMYKCKLCGYESEDEIDFMKHIDKEETYCNDCAKIDALKDVVKLMNKIREKEAVVTTADWEELKQMIEGDSEK